MRTQILELRARDIVDAVLAGQPVEDSTVELKAKWIEAVKAAPRLAGHANAARGDAILWIMGVDEKNQAITGVDSLEFENWYKEVESQFDGFAPRLVTHTNIRYDSHTVVALYFGTAENAPYVVKNPSGGRAQFYVPWREGTYIRAAKRAELLRILVPRLHVSALIEELEFNISIAEATVKADLQYHHWGTAFRDEEFHRAMRDGAIGTLPDDVKQVVREAYVVTGRANRRVEGALNTSMAGPPVLRKAIRRGSL